MFTANQTLWSLARSGEIYCLFFHIIIVLLYHNNNPSIAMMQASTPHIYSTEGTFQSNVSFILWTTSLRSLGQSFIGSCHRSMKLSSLPFIFAPSFSYKKHKLVPKSLCYNQAAVFFTDSIVHISLWRKQGSSFDSCESKVPSSGVLGPEGATC